jgi:hypothetical protein
MRTSRYQFSGADEFNDFVKDFAARLRAEGQLSASQQIASTTYPAYTTSSEWIGELGLALRAVDKNALSRDLRQRFERIDDQVRMVYPAI